MEKVGQVSEKEKKVMLIIFEKRCALEELEISMNNTDLSEREFRILKEKYAYIKPLIEEEFNNWWKSNADKYGWKRCVNKVWNINFESNEIFLV
ncbi:MAG: CXXX repeat peptide modification system protein [Terrisporobacter sp.]|uniref:CXXX repeat peptide modification system protein n=1 Tax=Clostridium sp. TaxID=1506 RepID=UPI0030693E3A